MDTVKGMAKIPFTLEKWLKDKSQRVETRDGRIVHNIWRVKEPTYTNNRKAEVCALIDGEEDALVFFEGGRYLPTTRDTDSPFDLFIVTPELELTEFEEHLKRLLDFSVTLGFPYEIDCIKSEAAELLDLSRKEFVEQGYVIEKKLFHDTVEKIDDKHKAEMSVEYSLHCKIENGTRHAIMNWNEFQKVAQHFIDCGKEEALEELKKNLVDKDIYRVPEWLRKVLATAKEIGREEALKDLPRWKKAKEYIPLGLDDFCFILDGDGKMSPYWDTKIEKGQYFITESDIEKLPKED